MSTQSAPDLREEFETAFNARKDSLPWLNHVVPVLLKSSGGEPFKISELREGNFLWKPKLPEFGISERELKEKMSAMMLEATSAICRHLERNPRGLDDLNKTANSIHALYAFAEALGLDERDIDSMAIEFQNRNIKTLDDPIGGFYDGGRADMGSYLLAFKARMARLKPSEKEIPALAKQYNMSADQVRERFAEQDKIMERLSPEAIKQGKNTMLERLKTGPA